MHGMIKGLIAAAALAAGGIALEQPARAEAPMHYAVATRAIGMDVATRAIGMDAAGPVSDGGVSQIQYYRGGRGYYRGPRGYHGGRHYRPAPRWERRHWRDDRRRWARERYRRNHWRGGYGYRRW